MRTSLHSSGHAQRGIVLLESLIAILVFSLGILALVSMQAFAVNAASDAQYRSDAVQLANELIGSMWASDRTPATLEAAFESPGGTGYAAWRGDTSTPEEGTVLGTLPGTKGVATNYPTVAITQVTDTTQPSALVTITIYWQAPTDQSRHSFTTITQIGG